MEKNEGWQRKVQQELAMAHQARREGNEGQARVCARRAAGFAAEAYFQQRGFDPPAHNAYQLLERLGEEGHLPDPVRETLSLLTLRVNKAFELPPGVDLIRESKKLIRVLFPDERLDLEVDQGDAHE
ncbi:MAG: hypothetical protein ACQEQQ_02065 [Chloroflexota bacterium]